VLDGGRAVGDRGDDVAVAGVKGDAEHAGVAVADVSVVHAVAFDVEREEAAVSDG
jgi:hypothetical protein